MFFLIAGCTNVGVEVVQAVSIAALNPAICGKLVHLGKKKAEIARNVRHTFGAVLTAFDVRGVTLPLQDRCQNNFNQEVCSGPFELPCRAGQSVLSRTASDQYREPIRTVSILAALQ